jgi:MoaA/NifB/PqqE/SkfB family radical SAM enzyme
MSLEMAEKIAQFAKNNQVVYFNIMGGEFYCHPQWKDILNILIPSVKIARIVSNGDWYENNKIEIVEFFKKYKNAHISISDDKWHTNTFSKQAYEYLQSNNIISNIGTDVLKSDGIVPIGRAQYEYSFYSSFSSYCSKSDSKYSFLIDEKGEIYKCGFGVWNYADVDSYMNDFRKRFKKVSQRFENTFIPSCKVCYNSYLNTTNNYPI